MSRFEVRLEDIWTWLIVIAIGGIIGYFYTVIVYLQVEGAPGSIWLGLISGMVIAGASGGFELFYVSKAYSPIKRLPFIYSLVLRVFIHLVIILGSFLFLQVIYDMMYDTGILMFVQQPSGGPVTDVGFALLFLFIIIFFMQMRMFIGGRPLKNLILGKYNQPQNEERIFMFLDITGSTQIARKIGDVAFHKFLNRLFILFDRPINRNGGEVHSYVGDAIIAIWPLSKNKKTNMGAFKTLLEIDALCEQYSDAIRDEFGVTPGVRAALHGGPVVVGETGDSKRQITYLGDTVNITARIEAKAKDLGEPYLVSDSLIERCELPEGFEAVAKGKHILKGADEKIALSALRIKNNTRKG